MTQEEIGERYDLADAATWYEPISPRIKAVTEKKDMWID